MSREKALRQLLALDQQCCRANSLWRSLETMKMSLAESYGISESVMKREGIFVETPERKSNEDQARPSKRAQ